MTEPTCETADERIATVVADLDDGRFAVLRVYLDRPKGDGVLSIVQSVHHRRYDAELWCDSAFWTGTDPDRKSGSAQ